MERVSRVLGKLRLPEDTLAPEELVSAAWKVAVGKRIARHARPERLVRARLVIGVDDPVWQRQLFGMRGLILDSIRKTLGRDDLVEDLEFRVASVRRPPERAQTAKPADEADGISDPILRRFYVAARKKEPA